MSRGYYNTGAPFLYSGGEAVGPGMDCLQLRQPPGPFHYLISEQAKSLVALQELQHEVGALLEFRDLVIETFPNLRTKLASSTPATMTSHHTSNIPVSIRPGDWTPGVRVRKKLGSKDEPRIGKKSGDIAVQDSGFSTETSSKETHSASSTAPPPSTAAGAADETEDELWNLLDVIHRKGTRLKDEVEALQGALREQGNMREENDFQRVLFTGSADDIRQLRQERDLLLDRLAEMEAEVLAGRVHTSRLQEDLENLLSAKHDLEEQLKAVVSQRGEVNSRIHDLHLQFVTKSGSSSPDGDKSKVLSAGDSLDRRDSTTSQRTPRKSSKSVLDLVLGDKIPKVKVPDSKKIAAILKEQDPLVLQKHLLTSTVQNQVLSQQLDTAARVEIGLADKLDKAREENDELRFQLEDKNIELEGTRARVRMLEQLQKSVTNTSPDVIPDHPLSRSEITTASMKAMSPLPLNLQMDHSSSTESAHDQAENNRKSTDSAKRRPSKIPLKSYTAPKPPGGKHSPAPGARSRSGESPGRPHSAQSWRNRSEGNSLSGSKSNSSLPKSRNGSLVSAKDSLSSKLRSSDSLSKLSPSNNNSFGSNRGTLRKTNNAAKWTNSSKDVTDKVRPKSTSFWNFFKLHNGQT
jgi:predicted nuclease with TOPRIM domain